MNKSLWGVLVILMGVAGIVFIAIFQTITNTDEHNSQIMKEVTEAAMWDAVDQGVYKKNKTVRINREKFIENFLRRFSTSAQNGRNYKIEFYDVNELPPKVSIRVSSQVDRVNPLGSLIGGNETFNFELTNQIDAILETPY